MTRIKTERANPDQNRRETDGGTDEAERRQHRDERQSAQPEPDTISVADRYEPCIGFHVEALIRAGASGEDVADVLATRLQMSGRPSLMYAAKALDAFDQLSRTG